MTKKEYTTPNKATARNTSKEIQDHVARFLESGGKIKKLSSYVKLLDFLKLVQDNIIYCVNDCYSTSFCI